MCNDVVWSIDIEEEIIYASISVVWSNVARTSPPRFSWALYNKRQALRDGRTSRNLTLPVLTVCDSN